MLGISYFRSKRYLQWQMASKKYAVQHRLSRSSNLDSSLFSFVHVTHQTPLLRDLAKVNMWMQYNKVVNLKIAIQKVNGVSLLPGETFSYWRLIGKPTRRKGYLPGMMLNRGKVQSGIGGGLCQLSNLIYWMTLHTSLVVTERFRHSYDVFPDSGRVLPFGCGATCFYNYIDLQIHNPTQQTYQLCLEITDRDLIGMWRSDEAPRKQYKVYEKKHWISQEYGIGNVRHNEIHRLVYREDGEFLEDEFITENHALMMYNPWLK